MTYVDLKLNLPDDLARTAKAAGLLDPRELERLVRDELRRAAAKRLLDVGARFKTTGSPEMSEKEIVAEVKAARREMRESPQKVG